MSDEEPGVEPDLIDEMRFEPVAAGEAVAYLHITDEVPASKMVGRALASALEKAIRHNLPDSKPKISRRKVEVSADNWVTIPIKRTSISGAGALEAVKPLLLADVNKMGAGAVQVMQRLNPKDTVAE